ncbi:MAG: hypothetical protein CMM87_06460 [Rickettsiales bacterium]|nr:hypothetical protein [Rickettsiales bacterium]
MRQIFKLALVISFVVLPVKALQEKVINGNVFRTGTYEDVIDDFKKRVGPREVITFIGYSGRGYEREDKMLKMAEKFLKTKDPKGTVVNIGVTPEGIGAIYPLAKEMGFETFGIVSTQASEYLDGVSNVDNPYLVEDKAWGGYIDASKKELTPTSKAMVDVSNMMIAYGAGDVGLAELEQGIANGVKVKAYLFDENHQKSTAKALKSGKPAPKIFYLPAFKKFVIKLNSSLRKTDSIKKRRNSRNELTRSKSVSGF